MSSVNVEIETIAAGGDGLARPPGEPVIFVPRAAPGDQLEVEVTESHRQWRRGRIVRVLQAGPDRADPPCPYYTRCGGCQLQHLRYPAQLEAKAGIVADALRRLGGLDVEPPEVVPSPLQLGYRNRVTLALQRTESGVNAGYHAHDAPGETVDVASCPLAEPPINRVWSALREAWGPGAERLPAGEELRLTLRAAEDGVGLAIQGGEGYGDPERLLDEVEGLVSIWGVDERGVPDWYVGQRTLADTWGEHRLEVAGLAFVQVNRGVADRLESYARELCGDVAGRRVIDAYCGFGTRALEFAWRGARVVGIDRDPHAVGTAEAAAVESGATARFRVDRVERALGWELPADLVVLNPPRAGVDRQVCEALLKEPPVRIVYVSCDPATLARDLAQLGPTFQVDALRAFDMFPQTAHVETVVRLDRRSGS